MIDEAEVDLMEGLNVLTGETGAGKSILLGSINLALGGRGGKEMMRDPKKGAEVDLVFYDESPKVQAFLEERSISAEEGQIVLSRRYQPSGRSGSFINGTMVSGKEVKDLAALLIDIHGQHEHQSLLDQSKHIDLLDRFIPGMGSADDGELQAFRKEFEALEELKKELAHYEESGRDRARLLSLMEYETKEIEDTNWQKGEEEDLQEEKKKLLYSGKLSDASLSASALLKDNDRSGESAISRVDKALAHIRQVQDVDSEFFAPFVDQLQDVVSVLEDAAWSLMDYGEKLDQDPERLDALEDRLTQIQHLQDKYGKTYEKVMAYYDKTFREMQKLRHLEETVETLKNEIAVKEKTVRKLAGAMHEKRVKAAKTLSEEITKELSTLQFEKPLFKVEVTEKALSPKGADNVVFMIRTNVGEEEKPLNKIASGGEMSRVMLAIKTVLARQDEIGCLIFDEIDTGISGRTAQRVAEKMRQIAVYHQVICVTHLPQIAAMAQHHLVIEKSSENEHTATNVKALSEEEVPEELARMLGGAAITDAVRQNAREMRNLALSFGESLT